MDGILDMHMTDILKEIAVEEPIARALLGQQNELRDVFDIVRFYERAAWQDVSDAAARQGIPEGTIPDLFVASVAWANSLLSGKEVAEMEAT
jgi:c-di-GMP-related signal transduction protein